MRIKKIILRYSIPVVVLFFLLLPSLAFSRLVPCDTNCDFNYLGELANNVLNFIVFVLAVPIATLAILTAGVMMVIYSSNPEKRKQSINIITTAILGLLFVLAGYLIIQSIVYGLTGHGSVGSRLSNIFQR